MTVSRTEIMRTMRAKGVSLKDIGEQFGITDSRVAQLIRMPLGRTADSKARTAQMLEMNKAGQTLREIGSHFGVTHATVRARIESLPGYVGRDSLAPVDEVIVPKWVKNPTLRERYLNIAERHDEHVAASIIRTAMRSGVTL